jgi:hypothetical protein
MFVERLSLELTGQRVQRVQAEVSDVADALIGTEKHWSSCGPGALFNLLVGGAFINPWVMVDEIDKAPDRHQHAGIVKVLYALLERESARRFADRSLPEVTLDASHLSWIATANGTDTIEPPLLDRFQVFRITAPTAEQAQEVVRRMDARLRDRRGWRRLPPLTPELVAQISQLPPRRVGKLLRDVLASLVVSGADACGPAEQALVRAELRRHAQDARTRRPPTEAEVLQGIMALSAAAALKALELTGRQAWLLQLARNRGPLH